MYEMQDSTIDSIGAKHGKVRVHSYGVPGSGF